jgi:hypothetical protein
MNRAAIVFAVGLALAAALPALPAAAQANRTFVSGLGSDTNPCTLGAPCRSFAQAISVTNASGEIDVLDPAGYGAITISHAISIQGHGFAGVSTTAGGTGIAISAGTTDTVNLNGLLIEGEGTGQNGIILYQGGNLEIINCVVRHFTASGILIQPTSGTTNFLVSNTIVSDNNVGIFYLPPSGSPSARGIVDHVVATSNRADGVVLNNGTYASGGTNNITISNSIFSDNSTDGIYAYFLANSPGNVVNIDSSYFSNNTGNGIDAEGAVWLLLGRSVVTGNGTGILNNTVSGQFDTYGDNRINWNGTDISSPMNNTADTPR